MNLFNKKTGNRGFTLIELLVTIAVLAILVLLGTPRLLNYTQKAQLTRIQHDTKVMEQEMGTLMVENEVDIGGWENNNKSFNQLIAEDKLFEKEGVAEKIYAKHLARDGVLNLSKYFRETTSSNKTLSLNDEELETGGESYPVNELPEDFSVDKTYKIVPEEYSKKINTKLKGTFYVNSDGKVYYEHGKPIPGEEEGPNCPIPSELGYDFQLVDGKGTIVSWTGTTQYLTIPPYFLLDGECVPVQVIGRGAFMRGNFKRITLPMTLEKIHEGAFGNEISAEELYIPHTNMDIEDNFFSEGSIGEINISGETNSYNPIKFKGANVNYTSPSPTPNDLGIIIHPESGTIISSNSNTKVGKTNAKSEVNNYAEHNYSGGTLVIPEKIKIPGRKEPIVVKKVAKGAFQGEGLIEVNLPFTLERIEAYAFAGNQLDWVEIPQSVKYIGEYAFAFNQHIHSSNNNVKPTIKSIKIKGRERINDVKLGSIVDGSGTLINPLDGVEMKEYIWVTDADNFQFEEVGPEEPGIPVNPENPGPEEPGEPGKPAEPREPIGGEIAIDSADKLAKIGAEYSLDGKYILTANIDLSGYSKGEGWAPIGSYTSSTNKSPFTGSFDGNGYKITGLTINGSTENYVGLFGYTEGATIRNVALEDININGNNYVGGLVGYASSSTIDNSYATGSVTGTAGVGGLVGLAANSTTISNSYATGSVTGTGGYVGGLVGEAQTSTISNSYSTGSVTGTGSHVGGLVGYSYSSTIENSYATGSVTGTGNWRYTTRYVGGLVGYAGSSTTISNSYATGEVSGSNYAEQVGGLVGYLGGTPNDSGSATIINSYATGSVKCTGTYVGGLVGDAYRGTIEGSYATGRVEGSTGGWAGGLVGLATTTTISNSYATGSVITSGGFSNKDGIVRGNNVGGLVGQARGSTEISNSYATGSVRGAGEIVGGLVGGAYDSAKISNSYATGSVRGYRSVGGLVGRYWSSTPVTNSYWDTETTGQPSSHVGEAKSTEEMMKQTTYEGWNFDNLWKIDEGQDYPKLR